MNRIVMNGMVTNRAGSRGTAGALWLGLGALAWISLAGAGAGAGERGAQGEPEVAAGAVKPAAVAPAVSVNALMVDLIDPASHVIWDAAREEKAPKNDEDWRQIEVHGVQLAAAGTLIALGGTGEFDAGWAAEPGWRAFAQQLTGAGTAAIQAAQDRALDGVLRAGDQLIEVCEGCHQQYKPPLPSEGIVHPR